MSGKKNSKAQLVIIIALICCSMALVGVAIALGLSGGGKPAKDSTPQDEWTQNY